jgi:hypothetical protein
MWLAVEVLVCLSPVLSKEAKVCPLGFVPKLHKSLLL